MLFKKEILERIKTGDIKLAFRKWKRPTVKKGGTLLTPVGQLRILDLKPIELTKLTDTKIQAAGIENVDNWRQVIEKREGDLYQIHLIWEGEDPRIALRSQPINAAEFEVQSQKLQRMDARSAQGPWTIRILRLIKEHPGRLARLLADEMGVEKSWLKPNIRKLKTMGLTISLEVGYKLSVRGESFIERLDAKNE